MIRILPLLVAAAVVAGAELPLEVVSLRYSVPSGISYDPQREIAIDVGITNDGDEPIALDQAVWRVRRTRELLYEKPSSIWHTAWTDFETVAEGGLGSDAPASLAPGRTVQLYARFTPGRYGTFSLLLDVDGAGGREPARLSTAAVIHEPAAGFKPRSFYQVGLSDNNRNNTRAKIDMIGRLGFKWVRWGGCSVKPATGEEEVYDWSRTDPIVEALRDNHVLIQGELMPYEVVAIPEIGGRPITYVPGREANLVVPPEHFGAPGEFGTFADHVFSVVERYGDVFRAGYIRNEPWEGGSISHYHATAAYMRAVSRVAQPAAKAANPDFQFIGVDSADNFVDQILVEEGMAGLFDGTTHHNYGSAFKNNRGAVLSRALGIPALENENWASPADFFVIASITQKVASGLAMVHPVSKGVEAPAYGNDRRGLVGPRPIAQVAATWLHFVEDTRHDEELFPWHLPYVNLFRGREDRGRNAAVVVGHIKMYGGSYRAEDGDAFFPQVMADGTLVVEDPDAALVVSDIEGNEITERDGTRVRIPLTRDSYYVVSSAGFDDLRAKLAASEAEWRQGPGCELAVHDLTRRLEDGPELRVHVANRLLATQDVTVAVSAPAGWRLARDEQRVRLAPGEERELGFPSRRRAPTRSTPTR